MAEYIEREAAKRCVKEHYDDAIVMALDALPAVDVAPVRHGRWIYQGQKVIEETFPTYRCSSCLFLIPGNWRTNCRFCPNCGAKMEA